MPDWFRHPWSASGDGAANSGRYTDSLCQAVAQATPWEARCVAEPQFTRVQVWVLQKGTNTQPRTLSWLALIGVTRAL